MIKYWKYTAITRTGSEVFGHMKGEYRFVLEQLNVLGMHVIDLQFDYRALINSFKKHDQVSSFCLAAFFEDFHNMCATGMTITQILQTLKETIKDQAMVDILLDMELKVRSGEGLHEAVAHFKAFPWIVCMTLRAGEQSGRLQGSLEVLSKYFRRCSEVQHRLTNALTYPIIVFVILIVIMLFVGLKVIPQLQSLLPIGALHHGVTPWIMAISKALQHYWLCIILCPLFLTACAAFIRSRYKEQFQSFIYQFPIFGNILKESDLAFYFLNLSVLLRSNVPLLKSISDLNALNYSQVSQHFVKCKDYMLGGMSFWEALKMDPFFSSVVVFTIRRGEEMARLDQYCFNLAGYFDKRVCEKVDRCIHFIQPALLMVGGLFLAAIAFAFLVPIYGSLTQIAGG